MEIVELPNGLGSKLRAVEGLVVGEDWSGTGVERFGTTSTRFEHCRFERMRVGQFTAGGAGRFAEFVDCSFDRSHLSFSPAGRTRFVRCSFRRARLVDFRVNPVDLIDCDFTGADVRRSIFWGGLDDYKRRREPDLRVRNDIRGNDFSGATLVDTSFRRGVDLTLQRLPAGEDCALALDGAAALDRVRALVDTWDRENRRDALGRVEIWRSDLDGGQEHLFVCRPRMKDLADWPAIRKTIING